jgi:hypothetical protein
MERHKGNRQWKIFWDYNCFMGIGRTSWIPVRTPKRSLACWVDFLVCPRRYLAVLPSHARANLFAGD